MPSATVLFALSAGFTLPPPKLAEIRTDSPPPFTDVEYVEIAGVAGYSLAGLSVVVIGDADQALGPALGNSGVVESVIQLEGHAVPEDRTFLIHSSPLLLQNPDLLAQCGLEDADNLTVLLVRDCAASVGDDLDIDDDGVLDSPPWVEVIDAVSLIWGPPGKASEFTYANARAGPNGGIFIFHARRCLDTDAWVLGAPGYPSAQESAGLPNGPCGGVICVADVNTDGTRDPLDLARVLSDWDRLGTPCDLDGNGYVGSGDIAILLSQWGPCDL